MIKYRPIVAFWTLLDMICRNLTLAAVVLALLAGCAGRKTDDELTEGAYYRKATESLEKKAYLTAIDELEELEARFPYGDYAEQALLDLVYARYKSLDYPGAAAQADRFLRAFPASDATDYVLYIKGLAYNDMNLGLLARFSESRADKRDLDNYIQSFRTFEQLVRRYPDSDYAADARARMLWIRNQLAAQEIAAATYYARRGALIAAINRAKHVIVHYQRTPSVPEALAIMSRAYHTLEQPVLAEKARKVLANSWPESDYLDSDEDSGISLAWWPREQDSLLSLLTFDLL